MSLGNLIENMYVAMAGDRIDFVGKCGVVVSLTLGTLDESDAVFNSWTDISSTVLGLFSGALVGGTNLGYGTAKYFRRTSKHIEKFGYLDSRFAKKLIKGSNSGALIGYCQLQGLYLAAKKHGQLEVFDEVREKYSNVIIPNF